MSNFCDNKSKFFSDLFSDNNKKVKRNTIVCCAAATKHHFTSLLSLKKILSVVGRQRAGC